KRWLDTGVTGGSYRKRCDGWRCYSPRTPRGKSSWTGHVMGPMYFGCSADFPLRRGVGSSLGRDVGLLSPSRKPEQSSFIGRSSLATGAGLPLMFFGVVCL
ncbi:unnamed protein product, partial [Discosporangium mesarthrocarpum]